MLMVLTMPGYSNVNVHSAAGDVDGNSGVHRAAPEHRLLLADHNLLLGCQVVKGEDEPDSWKFRSNLLFEVFNLRSTRDSSLRFSS